MPTAERLAFPARVLGMLLVIAVLWSVPQAAVAEDVLGIENEFIRIFINTTSEEQSRFGIDVTGGNPNHDRDDNKPLVYGHPTPWASYTTIRVDGEDYVFGTETQRRAGKDANYGEIYKEPEVIDDEEILSAYIMDGVKTYQRLGFAKNITTGFPDTARIEYTVENTTDEIREVGVRVMIDTKLGENDGAPFRIKDEAVLTTRKYLREEDELPTYWQAFDSLSQPAVISQGTLRGPDLTPPDEVYVADWGSLADGVWDFQYEPGREFIRRGEFALDSAIALYWNPEPLEPGEKRSYVTYYGLGGLTMMPGMLSLGVSSPEEVIVEDDDTTFPIIAYVENTADFEARDVEITLNLPDGLELAESEKVRAVDDMEPEGTEQVSWKVRPVGNLGEELTYRVEVEASNTDDNEVERTVKLLSPAELVTFLRLPQSPEVINDTLTPVPMRIEATIKNIGGAPAYAVQNTLELGDGLNFARRETATKPIWKLSPGESLEIPWQLVPNRFGEELEYRITAAARNAPQSEVQDSIAIPKLDPILRLRGPGEVEAGEVFAVNVMGLNLLHKETSSFNLSFDDSLLRLIETSRGTMFVEDDQILDWNQPEVSGGTVKNIGGTLPRPATYFSGTVATLYFRALNPGEVELELEEVQLTDKGGENMDLRLEGLMLQVLSPED